MSLFLSHSTKKGFDFRISLLETAYKNLVKYLSLLLIDFSVSFFFFIGSGGITIYGYKFLNSFLRK